NDADTLAVARLICDRSEAGQHADLFGGRAAELGQAGDKCRGDCEAEARDRGQDGITSGQAGVGLDALEDLAVECGNILAGSADAAVPPTLAETPPGPS